MPYPGAFRGCKEVFGTGELHYTQDSADLLNDPDINLVIIDPRPNSHAWLALQMLESRKPVIVEKPLALKSSQAETLRHLGKRNHLLIGCHQNRRWNKDYCAIKLALNEGPIGALFCMQTFVGGYGHPCGFWYSQELVCGGASFDWGIHYPDWMHDLMPGTIAELRCTRQDRVGSMSPTPTRSASTSQMSTKPGLLIQTRPLSPKRNGICWEPGARLLANGENS